MMGCGSSKSAVAPVSQLGPLPAIEAEPQMQDGKQAQHGDTVEKESSITRIGSKKICQNEVQSTVANESQSTSNVINVQEADIHSKNENDRSESSQYSSRESIDVNTRLISANSTQSKASQDSGLGEEYVHVITEGSDSSTKEIANLPKGMQVPNLTIEGEKLETSSSVGHHRKRLPPIQPMKSCASGDSSLTSKRVTFSNDLIDELPDTPSIIKRPCSRGGLAFDIVLDETSPSVDPAIRRKPVHLKKLEQKRGAVSHEELDEKQRAAGQRRKVLCNNDCSYAILIAMQRTQSAWPSTCMGVAGYRSRGDSTFIIIISSDPCARSISSGLQRLQLL